jgi:hypothetical protein
LRHHGGQVDFDTGLDAQLGEVGLRFVIALGGVQQRLGGNAADIETGAAEYAPLVDTGGLQPQLAEADGGIVAAGTAADDDCVECVSHEPATLICAPQHIWGEVCGQANRTGRNPGFSAYRMAWLPCYSRLACLGPSPPTASETQEGEPEPVLGKSKNVRGNPKPTGDMVEGLSAHPSASNPLAVSKRDEDRGWPSISRLIRLTKN